MHIKKILIINTVLNKGGAARVANDIFQNLNSNFDIYFAYGRGKRDKNGKTFYFGNKLETLIHIFLVRFLGLEGFGNFLSTRKLIKFIEKENFNVINIHNLHGYYLNFFKLLKYLKRKKNKIIYTLHDEWPITWLPAHSMECTHCKTGEGVCTNTYKYPKNFFPLFTKYMLNKKRSFFSNFKDMTIVCPSDWLAQKISESFLSSYKIKVINNSIDTNIFKPKKDKMLLRGELNLPKDKKIVLFTASQLNDKSKGIDYIIDASELVDDHVLFVGLGSGKIENCKNIVTKGYIHNKETLAKYYNASDLFCFASAAETFLLSAAEAMSCGVPVVGFDIEVVRELITRDVGLLTEKTSQALKNTIVSLLNNDNLRLEMGIKGKKLIENKYTKEIFYKKYTDLFN